MERRVGKYTIQCTKEEIIANNFFKHDFWIKTVTTTFVLINKSELFYVHAKILRYSNDEKEITDALEEIIQNRIFQLNNLKRLVD